MIGIILLIIVIFILFLTLLLLGIGVFLSSKDWGQKFNSPKICIHDTRHSNGYVTGSLIPPFIEEGVNNRVILHYTPTDVDVREERLPQKYIAEKDKIIVSSKGSWSKGRTIFNVFPSKLSYLPSTDIKLGLGKFVENTNINITKADSMRIWIDRLQILKRNAGEGELSTDMLSKLANIPKQLIDKFLETRKKDEIGRGGLPQPY